ncbi:hypothetical protein J1605_007511 [Eschrichtius robustus]|uniref:Uncharacterized protein n=1 Tax=Eschrichtius robustus TaxID=9764 RepID=A0AB34H235_ESCRO|nr:hypothetical protein J1605_007511 [Eschrichtius robustus]
MAISGRPAESGQEGVEVPHSQQLGQRGATGKRRDAPPRRVRASGNGPLWRRGAGSARRRGGRGAEGGAGRSAGPLGERGAAGGVRVVAEVGAGAGAGWLGSPGTASGSQSVPPARPEGPPDRAGPWRERGGRVREAAAASAGQSAAIPWGPGLRGRFPPRGAAAAAAAAAAARPNARLGSAAPRPRRPARVPRR